MDDEKQEFITLSNAIIRPEFVGSVVANSEYAYDSDYFGVDVYLLNNKELYFIGNDARKICDYYKIKRHKELPISEEDALKKFRNKTNVAVLSEAAGINDNKN